MPSIFSCRALYSSSSFDSLATTKLKIFVEDIAVDIYKSFKSERIRHRYHLRHFLIYTYYTAQISAIQMCKWDLTLPILCSLFGLFVFLLWLGIHNRSVFLVQIQLDIKSV